MALRYEDLPVRDGGFTVDDLEAMPDDGRRYELIDGVLFVSPAPRWEHQHACVQLTVSLSLACPPELVVFGPTPDVRKGARTSVQPDLCVVRSTDLIPSEPYLGVPLLAVEVLSPSSEGIDRLLKRDVYARLGVPQYWIVDAAKPAITVLALTGTTYSDQATVRGDELLAISDPFPVAVRPAQLVRT
jgi:Uma2 family endonuclease